MLDLNRPLHAYDADKIQKGIIVRNSKKGETFTALDKKEYKLSADMCVISDKLGVLGLGGIIGGTRSGTELETKNVLIESAYFNPRSIRKTSKKLNIDTDAKFRFERGIDPLSTEHGLIKSANLIKEICGGEISKIDIQNINKLKRNNIKFEIKLFEKISGFKISNEKILKILTSLGFEVKIDKNFLKLLVPSWRPDIDQPIDVVEELMRIYGYDKIKQIDPIKTRLKPTLKKSQKQFHFLQRAIASKGYQEAITWSFTDSDINDLFKSNIKNIEIINPISSDLNVLRNSIFSNLVMHIKKVSRSSWLEKERNTDIFDIKKDIIQTLDEAGYNKSKIFLDDQTPDYYHPGKSGRIFLNKEKDKVAAYFGEIHPNILKKIDIKTEALIGFEIFFDNLKIPNKSLKDQKSIYKVSDFQKSERDFAFIIDKDFNSQELIEII